jgi:hypothetical protein
LSQELRWICLKSLKKKTCSNLCNNRLKDYVECAWKAWEIILEGYLRGLFERDHLRELRSEGEIFNKEGRNRILRQTTRKLKILINKTLLFAHV